MHFFWFKHIHKTLLSVGPNEKGLWIINIYLLGNSITSIGGGILDISFNSIQFLCFFLIDEQFFVIRYLSRSKHLEVKTIVIISISKDWKLFLSFIGVKFRYKFYLNPTSILYLNYFNLGSLMDQSVQVLLFIRSI